MLVMLYLNFVHVFVASVHCNKRRVGLRGGVESTFHLFLQYLL